MVESIILETAVGCEKDVQGIDVHGEYEKLVVTLLVMRGFSDFPGASRACTYFRDPTAVPRIMRESYPNRSSMQALLKKAELRVTPPLNYATSGISPLIR